MIRIWFLFYLRWFQFHCLHLFCLWVLFHKQLLFVNWKLNTVRRQFKKNVNRSYTNLLWQLSKFYYLFTLGATPHITEGKCLFFRSQIHTQKISTILLLSPCRHFPKNKKMFCLINSVEIVIHGQIKTLHWVHK